MPISVAAEFDAILEAVAKAPPPSFSGGGKWEAMHGDMAGIYEIPGEIKRDELPTLLPTGQDVGPTRRTERGLP